MKALIPLLILIGLASLEAQVSNFPPSHIVVQPGYISPIVAPAATNWLKTNTMPTTNWSARNMPAMTNASASNQPALLSPPTGFHVQVGN